MGRAKRLAAGTGETGLAVEYIRTRNVVRLLGWLRNEPLEPVEIPVDQLCDRLGMDPQALGAPQRFMLFAGTQRPAGGLRDLVGTFEAPEAAWEAFRQLREAHPSLQGWAQLAAMDPGGKVHQLAWFGQPPGYAGEDASAPPKAVGDGRPLRRILSMPDRKPAGRYLRAVTPS